MTDQDHLHRFLFPEHACRGELVRLDNAWAEILKRSSYPADVRKLLGEAMAATALLAASVKFDGRLTLQVQGDGPLHLVLTQARGSGGLRGLARYAGLPRGDLHDLCGSGRLSITIETGVRPERYQGTVALEHSRLQRSLETYFRQSEQLATRLLLVAGAQRCAGLLLQKLPASVDTVEASDEAWNRLCLLTDTLSDEELLQVPLLDLLRRLYHAETVQVLGSRPVVFECTCSEQRVAGMLRAMGETEAREILAEQQRIEVRCEFCNLAYVFDERAVDAMFSARH